MTDFANTRSCAQRHRIRCGVPWEWVSPVSKRSGYCNLWRAVESGDNNKAEVRRLIIPVVRKRSPRHSKTFRETCWWRQSIFNDKVSFYSILKILENITSMQSRYLQRLYNTPETPFSCSRTVYSGPHRSTHYCTLISRETSSRNLHPPISFQTDRR
jgi:hypothetical protein